jgi:hypothetical protein
MEVTDTYIKVDGEFTLTWESVAGFVVYRSHTFIVDKYTKIYEMGKDYSDEFMKYFPSKDILPGPMNSVWNVNLVSSVSKTMRDTSILIQVNYKKSANKVYLRLKLPNAPFKRSVKYRTKIESRSTGCHDPRTFRAIREDVKVEDVSDSEDDSYPLYLLLEKQIK